MENSTILNEIRARFKAPASEPDLNDTASPHAASSIDPKTDFIAKYTKVANEVLTQYRLKPEENGLQQEIDRQLKDFMDIHFINKNT